MKSIGLYLEMGISLGVYLSSTALLETKTKFMFMCDFNTYSFERFAASPWLHCIHYGLLSTLPATFSGYKISGTAPSIL